MENSFRPDLACGLCGYWECVCWARKNHTKDCRLLKTIEMKFAIQCKHEMDICSECDKCSCNGVKQTFADLVMAGKIVDLNTIENDINNWHLSKTNCSLHEWLGLTKKEYKQFVEQSDSDTLPIIFSTRLKTCNGG